MTPSREDDLPETKRNEAGHVCDGCGRAFYTRDGLETHEDNDVCP